MQLSKVIAIIIVLLINVAIFSMYKSFYSSDSDTDSKTLDTDSSTITNTDSNNFILWKPIETRKEVGDNLQTFFPSEGKGIEIGVQRGENAREILLKWKGCNEFHLVDVWKPLKNYVDTANRPIGEQNQIYEQAKKNCNFPNIKIVFHKEFSSTAVKLFDDNYFDFIYIDARHDYTSVLEDLQIWWPKLKIGGVLGGHDFFDCAADKNSDFCVQPDGSRQPDGYAVKGAVIKFAKEINRQILLTYMEPYRSYFLIK